MVYLILLIFLFAIEVTALRINRNELLAPESIVILSMILCCLLAMVGLGTWNKIELGVQVGTVLLLATISFVVAAQLIERFCEKRLTPRKALKNSSWCKSVSYECVIHKLQIVPIWVYVLLGIGVCIAASLHVVETIEIGRRINVEWSNYSSLLKQIRDYVNPVFNGNAASFDFGYSFLDRQLNKVSLAISHIAAFSLPIVFCDKEGGKKSKASILTLFVLCCLSSLLSGDRGGLMLYFIEIIFSYWIFCRRIRQEASSKLIKLFIKIGLMGFVALMAFFYILSNVVGRDASSFSPIEYLSFYLGCGIPSFQEIMNQGVDPYAIAGFNTFHEQLNTLTKAGFIGALPGYGSQFIHLGAYDSNVFTFAYRYYADFGLLGAVVLSGVAGVTYNFLRTLTAE